MARPRPSTRSEDFSIGRFLAITSALIGLVAAAWAASVGPWAWWGLGAVVLAIVGVAAYDLLQRRHSILRNYLVVGHLRFLLETLRPELQQYFIERNWDGRPFDRDIRSLVYERAKGIHGELAFGTERDENGGDLVWEIGSGYSGARTDSGDFDPTQFADQAPATRSSASHSN